MKKFASVLGSLAVLGVGSFLFTEAEVALGGWDDAREEFRPLYEQIYRDLAIEPQIHKRLINCALDDSIDFLNTTDCSYLYNPKTTSEAEHAARQDACLNDLG